MNRLTLNIGLWAGTDSSVQIDHDEVLSWLQQRFQWAGAFQVREHHVTGEPTLVVFLHGATHASIRRIAYDLCRTFRQQAFACWSQEEGGDLFGPSAAEWGPFDSNLFIHMQGFING